MSLFESEGRVVKDASFPCDGCGKPLGIVDSVGGSFIEESVSLNDGFVGHTRCYVASVRGEVTVGGERVGYRAKPGFGFFVRALRRFTS